MIIGILLFIECSLYGYRAKCFTLIFHVTLANILAPKGYFVPPLQVRGVRLSWLRDRDSIGFSLLAAGLLCCGLG